MKKILIIFIAFLVFTANLAMAENKVTFVYLNGSNTNDEKTKSWFYDGINKFHPILKKTLESDPLTKEKMLRGLEVSSTPEYVYWGEMSKAEINFLLEEINFLNLRSPKPAQFTRRCITFFLHDAMWVAKMPHMIPVMNMLHKEVLEEHQKGNKVVLLGYSAGSFVTYQYSINKLPVIDLADLATLQNDKKEGAYTEAILNAHPQPTCVEAIFKAGLVSYSFDGNVTVNPSVKEFRKNLTKLDGYTKLQCAPPDTVIGVINYASPLVLFYSELGNPAYKMNEVNAFMYKYFIENGLFWLTVNYSDDPLGFPTTKNTTIEQVQGKTNMEITRGGGLFYDKSDLSSHRTFMMAHTSYWATGKRFSRNIVKAYKEGFEHFYKK